MMATLIDIAQIILLMQAAFPNYHPEMATPDALYQFLKDMPSDILKAAVLETCAQPGRVFAPTVGEIREAACKQSARVMGIPNEFEAWEEVCKMPKDMTRSRIELDEKGNMVTNEKGAVIIYEERLHWSHDLVGRTAQLLGWPEFPGENEGLGRAHFFQAYRAGINKLMESEGELPAVREFIEARRRNGTLPLGHEIKKLVERIPTSRAQVSHE